MMKRLALPGLFLSILAIAASYASAFLPGGAPSWAAGVFAVAIAGTLVFTMIIGASRNGRIGVLAIPFAFVFLVVAGGFLFVLSMPPADPADPELWLGLPPRAALVLYGIGLLPLLVMPLGYALTFDAMTLSEADLERVRREARALRGVAPDSTGDAPGAAR
jgi:hypothetical protein